MLRTSGGHTITLSSLLFAARLPSTCVVLARYALHIRKAAARQTELLLQPTVLPSATAFFIDAYSKHLPHKLAVLGLVWSFLAAFRARNATVLRPARPLRRYTGPPSGSRDRHRSQADRARKERQVR